MGGRRKGNDERREPHFDVSPEPEARRERSEPKVEAAEDDEDEAPRKPRKRKKSTGSRSKRGGEEPRRRGFIGRTIYWGAVASLWVLIAMIGGIVWVGIHLPPIQSLEIPRRPPTFQIVDMNGRALATRGDMGGAAVSLKELPRYVPQAFVAIEDRRFYQHYGIDPIGVTRALVANIMRRGVSQGGSTLTQQLAKNLFLTQERTLSRKIQEVGLALWLERKYSKTEILELYLNRVYFGAGAYGIEAAAQRYFNKPAQKLNVAEAAVLAGIVRSPSRLAPSRNPYGAERRAQLVLAAMADMKFITDDMAKIALIQPAQAMRVPPGGAVNYAADWVMDVLNDLVGRVEQDVVVETSIDPVLQASAERALTEELAKNGDKQHVGQGAIVSMTPDGAVRALVGGRNYADSQFNRAVAAKRQPGSAFKPFVYLTALERGLTPDTVREDKAISVKGWHPENYSREYFGPVTLKQALAMSLNTVSVRLVLEFGAPAVVRTAHRLGISSKLEANPSIALGTSEVSVLELVSAFAPFANGGDAITPHVVERVRGADGKVLYARKPDSLGRIIEPQYVSMMNAMMQETLLTGTARKADIQGWPAAGKTGTSQDFRDAWFVGYTAHLVTGVWLGNDDNSPMKKTTGGGMPVDVWSKFMKPAHQGVPVAALPGTGGLQTADLLPQIPSRMPWAPRPPEPVNPEGQVRPLPAANNGGMDNWFLDRIFGRR
jgi:penicillin-binding protein 1A